MLGWGLEPVGHEERKRRRSTCIPLCHLPWLFPLCLDNVMGRTRGWWMKPTWRVQVADRSKSGAQKGPQDIRDITQGQLCSFGGWTSLLQDSDQSEEKSEREGFLWEGRKDFLPRRKKKSWSLSVGRETILWINNLFIHCQEWKCFLSDFVWCQSRTNICAPALPTRCSHLHFCVSYVIL